MIYFNPRVSYNVYFNYYFMFGFATPESFTTGRETADIFIIMSFKKSS